MDSLVSDMDRCSQSLASESSSRLETITAEWKMIELYCAWSINIKELTLLADDIVADHWQPTIGLSREPGKLHFIFLEKSLY